MCYLFFGLSFLLLLSLLFIYCMKDEPHKFTLHKMLLLVHFVFAFLILFFYSSKKIFLLFFIVHNTIEMGQTVTIKNSIGPKKDENVSVFRGTVHEC